MHGDGDAGLHGPDDIAGRGGVDGEKPADGHHQHVDFAQRLQLLRRQGRALVAQVGQGQALHFDFHDQVFAPLGPARVVVYGRDGGNLHLRRGIPFPGAVDDGGRAQCLLGIIVVPVAVGHRDGVAAVFPHGIAHVAVVGIGEQGKAAGAFQVKFRMSVISDQHGGTSRKWIFTL